MLTPFAIAEQFGHIITRQQLLRSGLTGSDLTRAVRTGELRRIRQAHYATAKASAEAIAATRVGGMLCGVSAARSFGLWGGLDTRLHVALPGNAGRLRTNYPPSTIPSLQLGGRLTPDTSDRAVVLHWGIAETGWRVTLAECLKQVALWSDRETAIACLDTAWKPYGISALRLTAIFADEPPRSRQLAAESRPGSDSGLESLIRQRLGRHGIALRQQVEMPRVGRIDLGIVGTLLIIEADGYEFHSSSAAFEEDRRRDAELAAMGYVVIRLTYAQITGDWEWCERVILAAIASFRK